MYNDSNVPESNEYTLEVLQYTYLNMEVVLPCDGGGP